MQIRKITFIFVLLVNMLPSSLFAIRLIGEWLTTQKSLAPVSVAQVSGIASVSSVEQKVEMVQPKNDTELVVANVVNFVVPKFEELVSLFPDKTIKEIQITNVPNISITAQGLTKLGLGTLATVKKAYDKNFKAELVNKKYGHYDFDKLSVAEQEEINKEVNKQITKQWVYDIMKSHCVDRIYLFLEQKKWIPTSENKAEAFLLRYWIKQGLDMGIDTTTDYLLKMVA